MPEDCHIYLLPFRMVDYDIKVLLGKKLCYSKKDGWIHNNPGQYVIIGGGCGVDKRTRRSIKVSDQLNILVESSTREFIEETGNEVNDDKIYVQRFKDLGNFAISFYRVDTDTEYKKFTKITKFDTHVELSHTKWVSIDDALSLFEKNNKKNQHCSNQDLDEISSSYISDLYKNQWATNVNNDFAKQFNNFLRKLKMNSYNISDIEYIINDIKKYYTNSKYYKLYFDFLKYYIKKRSPIDWYYEGLLFLKNQYYTIDNTITRNISNKNPQSYSNNVFLNRNVREINEQSFEPINISQNMKNMSLKPSRLSQRVSSKSFAARSRMRPEKSKLPFNPKDRFKRW